MMAGNGPFGSIEMGGMFTVMKIRADLAHGDYTDPVGIEPPREREPIFGKESRRPSRENRRAMSKAGDEN